jgi:hypothetical protein
MKRLPGYHFDFGWGQGYVLLPEIHPFYGKHYDDINVDIHRGLTFSNKFESKNFLKWIEEYEIDGDVTKDNYHIFDNYWMIGFDTSHAGDSLYSCPKSYVLNQAEYLLDQCVSDNIKKIRKFKLKLRKDKLKKLIIIDKKE